MTLSVDAATVAVVQCQPPGTPPLSAATALRTEDDGEEERLGVTEKVCRRYQWRRIVVELDGRIDARFAATADGEDTSLLPCSLLGACGSISFVPACPTPEVQGMVSFVHIVKNVKVTELSLYQQLLLWFYIWDLRLLHIL